MERWKILIKKSWLRDQGKAYPQWNNANRICWIFGCFADVFKQCRKWPGDA